MVLRTAEQLGAAFADLVFGIAVATVLGALRRATLLAWAFRRAKVPEFMKVPVLFAMVLAIFARGGRDPARKPACWRSRSWAW